MDFEQEKEMLNHAVETARLNAEILQRQDKENKRLWIANVVSWVAVAFLLVCMVYQNANMDKIVSKSIAEAQETFNQAMIEALNTVADLEVIGDTTTTTTNTQTIEGDSAVINNVDGEQYNDSAQKVGGCE